MTKDDVPDLRGRARMLYSVQLMSRRATFGVFRALGGYPGWSDAVHGSRGGQAIEQSDWAGQLILQNNSLAIPFALLHLLSTSSIGR